MCMPIEQALQMQCAKVYCNGVRLWIIACGYCWPYAITIDNLVAVADARMVCKLVDAPPGASDLAHALGRQ